MSETSLGVMFVHSSTGYVLFNILTDLSKVQTFV